MRNSYLTKRFGLAFLAIALCIAAGVGTTFAYYTDSTAAKGSLVYSADQPSTDIYEKVDNAGKDISLKNTSDVPVMVRVKLYFSDANADITLQGKENTDWGFVKDSDTATDWIYYNKVLWPGEPTSVLRAEIKAKAGDEVLDNFKVNVVSQSVRTIWVEDDNGGYEAGDFDGNVVNIGAIKGIEQPITITGQKPSGM